MKNKNKMHAIVMHSYGGPEVLQYEEINIPNLQDDEVLIRVHGSSVNPVDCGLRAGALRDFIPLKLPTVLGVDVSGEIVHTGSRVLKFKVGDSVYAYLGLFRNGGYAEFVAVPEKYLANTPKNIFLHDAGVIPGAGLTAFEAFTVHAPIKKSSKVLINGAAGGVGTFAIQIAKSMGAEVTAICSTSKIELVKYCGADEIIDYTKTPLSTVENTFDVILNCVRGSDNVSFMNLLSTHGMLLVIAGDISLLPPQKVVQFFVQPNGDNLRQLTSLIEGGKVRPIIEKTYSWKNIPDAHRHSETGRTAGKIGLTID
jgi:NADPH:quinone reductase-like Zn-dependent oxidoreductase